MRSDDRRSPVSRRIATFDDLRDAIMAYRLPRVLIAALETKPLHGPWYGLHGRFLIWLVMEGQ